MDYAEFTFVFVYLVGGLYLPERREGYSSSRVEEEEGPQSYPCGDADESRTHIAR